MLPLEVPAIILTVALSWLPLSIFLMRICHMSSRLPFTAAHTIFQNRHDTAPAFRLGQFLADALKYSRKFLMVILIYVTKLSL